MYIPDRLANKQFPSLIKALGCVVDIKDRSVLFKLSNGQTILRHTSDLVSFNLAGSDKQNIDVLNLPLNGHPDLEPLWLSESEFNLWLPTINMLAVPHGKPITLSQVDDNLTTPHLIGCDELNIDNDTDTEDGNDKENNIHNVSDDIADNNNTNTLFSHVTHRWPKQKRKQPNHYGDFVSH